MTVEDFKAEVTKWIAAAKHPRWKRPYTELTYQPMQEVLKYLRANGYKTYIVTGGGQDFVRVYRSGSTASRPSRWSAPRRDEYRLRQERQACPDQGTEAPAERQQRGQAGRHSSDDRPPAGHAAFGNSTGDHQMLEYTKAGNGAR